MNTTANRSSSSGCSCLVNPEALKVGETVAYSLILVVSLVGNSLSALIVYKTPTLRKPINILIANMTMSDLLYPIFLFPVRLAAMHVGWWLILVVPLVRPYARYTLFLLMFPRKCRFRAWF